MIAYRAHDNSVNSITEQMRISEKDHEEYRIEHLQRFRITSDCDIRQDCNSPGIASGVANKERSVGEATALALSPSRTLGSTVRSTFAGGWNQISLAPFQSDASAVEIRVPPRIWQRSSRPIGS